MAQAIQHELTDRRIFFYDWSSLSEIELLALVLAPGSSAAFGWQAALRLSRHVGNFSRLANLSYGELRAAGIGHRRALALQAAAELWRRVDRTELQPGESFQSSSQVFEHFRSALRPLAKECFWDVLLDGKNRIISTVRVSEGSLTSSLVHPREVFRPAIREAAASVLFVHNHPSGDPAPSQEDIQITRRLVETGKIVGIRVLDHVIIGGFKYFSFADQGML